MGTYPDSQAASLARRLRAVCLVPLCNQWRCISRCSTHSARGGVGGRPDLHYDAGGRSLQGLGRRLPGLRRVLRLGARMQRFWREKAAKQRIQLSNKGGHEVSQTGSLPA